ncbi:probable chitinase 10 [Anopheles maculipalpis]|uniref:probable chitinase 10 n=1 Tax=Anopheles maculipalpis TaxID=1496333 RepID=UPI002158EFD4|nr:probable chitinase 10 [Anopheles maculipalpis]
MQRICVVLVLIYITAVTAQNIVCYYDNRSASYSTPTFPRNLSPTNCTHYIYDGVGVTAQGDIRILSSYDTTSGFDEFLSLRRTTSKLYVLLSSDRDGGKNLTNAIAGRSEKLVNNLAIFLEQYNFDGVEIDRRTNDFDKGALARFINRLRSRLYMINKQLSVAVSPQFTDAYDITSLSLYADMINLHAYNFTSTAGNTVVANLAPLFSSTPNNVVSVNSTVTSWLAAGARRSKMNLVVATYARTYVLASEDQRGVGARSTGPGDAGSNTKRAGLLARYEVCNLLNEYSPVSDSVTATTYYFKGKNWISIETEDMLVQKFTYVLDNTLAGVGVFTLDLDDVSNTCGNGAYHIVDLARQYFAEG